MNSVPCVLKKMMCMCCICMRPSFCFCSTFICYFEAAAIISARIQRIEKDEVNRSFHAFSSSKFDWTEVSRDFFSCHDAFVLSWDGNAVPALLVFRVPLLYIKFFKVHGVFRQSAVLNTQHKHIQNSLTVCPPPSSLIHLDTRAHNVFFF